MWYSGKRKPKLQIKILQEILNRGELSKIEFERQYESVHFHADIISGFENLKKHGLIEESQKRFRRGRIEILYSITTKGVSALILENPQEDYFWKSLISWLSSNKSPGVDAIDNVYRFFIDKFIGITYANLLYSTQLDKFDRLLIKWFNNNKRSSRSDISPSQIVLECLATNKELTFEELSQMCNLSKHTLSQVMDRLSIKMSYTSMYYLDEEDFYDLDKRTEQYIDFMMHCLIVVIKRNDKLVSYQLSLIGIMLVSALIMASKMDTSELWKRFGRVFKKPLKLSCSFSIESYQEKIASVHGDKLPLILGIWASLKNILGMNLMHSLHSVIDKNSRKEAVETPLVLGGIRELYNEVGGVIVSKRSKLVEFYNTGYKLLATITNEKNEEQIKRVEPLNQKLSEIDLFLKYSYISSFLDSLENENFSSGYDWRQVYNDHSNFIITSLKEEVSLLFYLILGNNNSYTFLPATSNEGSLEFIPIEALRKILNEHSFVKDKFNAWIKEIREYHRSTSHLIDNFLALK